MRIQQIYHNLGKAIQLCVKQLNFNLFFYSLFIGFFSLIIGINSLQAQSKVEINLNELALVQDSLFDLKFKYGRIGSIEDSLVELELMQLVLRGDSIHEELIYNKQISYAKSLSMELRIVYDGYQTNTKNLRFENLTGLYRTMILHMVKGKDEVASTEQKAIDAFIFSGTIYEENTQIRLPNVRVIVKDLKDPSKQFAEVTGPYGTFNDSVRGYPLNKKLSFEIYLKKEGYISKSFVFEEVLSEYGIVDLEEYLRKIKLTKAEVGVEIGKAANLRPIYFDLDKYDIRVDATVELNKVVSILKEEPQLIIELSSHTDSRADDDYNLNLSNQRSRSAADYLISKGISSKRLTTIGYGEKQLVNRCSNDVECTEAEHQMNRRTEFKITEIDSDFVRAETASSQKPGIALNFNLVGQVIEKNTFDELIGVEIVVSDKKTSKKIYETRSDFEGAFSAKMEGYKKGEVILLDISLIKRGYVTKSYEFNHILQNGGDINLNQLMGKMELAKISVDLEIGNAANINPIYFEVDKAEITNEAAIELDKIVDFLIKNWKLSVEVSSHTDSRASKSYNLELSDKRAKAVRTYLVSHGISYHRINAVGYGEQKLLNKCADGVECSDYEHEANRRTEFRITKLE